MSIEQLNCDGYVTKQEMEIKRLCEENEKLRNKIDDLEADLKFEAHNLSEIFRVCVVLRGEEIERLQKYEKLVQFIANDYCELSHDKVMWQRDDWKKRCLKMIEEDNAAIREGEHSE